MNEHEQAVDFYLEWFDDTTERLVGEYKLTGVSKQQIAEWLQLPHETDPLSGSFPVPPESLPLIAAQYPADVDNAACSYFITAFQPES